MGEAVSCCGKDVGDAGVNVGVVSRVTAELPAHGVGPHDVGQIIPKHEHLRENREMHFIVALETCSDCRGGGVYLCVSAHDLAGLLVEGLAVPLGVQFPQLASQTIVLAQKQGVKRRQGNIFIHTDVTWQEGTHALERIPSLRLLKGRDIALPFDLKG